MVQALAPHGQAWANVGYRTHVVEHTGRTGGTPEWPLTGVAATINAIQWFDLVRYAHPFDRICMRGFSSGGHLALLTAINRPDTLDCVITEASPTDITNTSTGTQAPTGFNQLPYYLLEPLVQEVFGSDPNTRVQFSPTAYSFGTPGLIPHAVHDYAVSVLQTEYAAQPGSRPGLFKYIVPDHVCDSDPPEPMFGFGHSCLDDGISYNTALTYVFKQLNMAAYGTP